MALSQKHIGKVLVPWFNTAEWRQVYNILCLQPDKNYSKILDILKIWKTRTPLLSAGVEGTLVILEAFLTEKENLTEYQLAQIYAVSIMRFLNLCATNNEKQGSFYKTAVKNELPKWLINIRHDIAHDHKLPSISILELGLQYCLDWIKIKYWQVQNEIISDWIVAEEAIHPKLIDVLKIYIQLNLNSFLKNTDITEYDENIMETVNDIVYKKSPQPTTDISDIISVLEEFISESLKKQLNDNDKGHIVNIVINEALLLTEIEVTTAGNCIIPKDWRNAWTNLLNILNENNFMPSILNSLIDVTNDIGVENNIREKAALWISEVLLGLQKAQLITEGLNKLEKASPSQLNIMKIKAALEERSPEFQDCLDFFPKNVSSFPDGNIFQEKLLNVPNNYTLHFLERALRFNKYSEDHITDVVDLVRKMLITKEPQSDSDIFTANDLENLEVINSAGTSAGEAEPDSGTTIAEDINAQITEKVSSRWTLVVDKSIYKGCPLGVLPHQNRNKNPLIIF